MRRILSIALVSLVFIACKTKETRTYELVQYYNSDKGILTSDSLRYTKAYILDKRTVALDYVFSTQEEIVTKPFMDQLADVLSQVSGEYPECRNLIKEGIDFKARIYNKYGIKIQEYPLEVDKEGNLKTRI